MSFLWPKQVCTRVDEKFLSLRKKMKPCKKKYFLDEKAIFLKLKDNNYNEAWRFKVFVGYSWRVRESSSDILKKTST